MNRLICLSLLLSALASFSTSHALALPAFFVGDFDTCDFSQWNRQDAEAAFRIVPAGNGRSCAASITLGPEDRGGVVNTAGDGAALWLERSAYGRAGRTVWQHFSIQFQHGFRSTPGEWNWVTQWHNDKGFVPFVRSGTIDWEYSNVSWTVRNRQGVERLALRIMGGPSVSPTTVWVRGPRLQTGHWYDFVVRTVWSPDPAKGSVTWLLDGRRIFSGRAATLYTRPDGSVSDVYFVQGYYRLHADWHATVLFDATRLGPSRASIAPR